MHESAKQWGVNTEQGLALHKAFQDAGLPKPRMCLEMVLGGDPDFTRWVYDALCSKKPVIEKLDLSFERLGDMDTLQDRLQAEVAASNTVVPWLALVGAWCRVPTVR